jgi:hypothetical protein
MTTARLQDHHLADLRGSGLTDETIQASRCYSAQEPTVRELLGFGVGPGLVFPYLGTEDQRGVPFVQVKPDKRVSGAKYFTPKGAGCRLYIPPTIPAEYLKKTDVQLYLTEGAKKALKATQEGLPCVAVSGVDAWRDRTNGKSAPIADLDRIAWRGRTVRIVFDSDLATKPPVRLAEFKLARELRGRGAEVAAVRLPGGPDGAKVGFDDFLVTHSVEAFCALEPEPIHHPARDEAARAKAEARDADTVVREGDDFTYTWTAEGIIVRLTRLRDQADVQGEIAISVHGRPLHWARINLASLSARETLVTKLGRTHAGYPWRDLLERVCHETSAALRASAPTVQLQPTRGSVERYLLDKLVLAHETNLLYADGGSGKSLTAGAVAVAVATGTPLPGGLTPHVVGPVLYLDWESCQEEHEDKLAGLLGGLGLSGPVPIFYRRMVGAAADEMPALRQDIARLAPVLLIVDSLGPACGTEPEGADAAIRALNSLRSLAVSRLVLAHVSKLHADQRGATRPFGSVYVMNLPRNVWEIRKADEEAEDTLTVGLYHRKSNRGRLLPPLGLRFEFQSDAIRIHGTDLAQDAGLRERAGLSYSIKAALRSGGRTIADLAEELEAKADTVEKTLKRMEKAGKVVRLSEREAGRPTTWGLTA